MTRPQPPAPSPQLLKPLCPRCGRAERQIKDGFTPAGSQRYHCKLCQTRYTPKPKEQGYDEEVRLQALSLYLDGLSLREISRLLSVNHQSVANWIHGYANHMPVTLPPSILEIAILDGFYTPPKSLRKREPEAISKALMRQDRQLIVDVRDRCRES